MSESPHKYTEQDRVLAHLRAERLKKPSILSRAMFQIHNLNINSVVNNKVKFCKVNFGPTLTVSKAILTSVAPELCFDLYLDFDLAMVLSCSPGFKYCPHLLLGGADFDEHFLDNVVTRVLKYPLRISLGRNNIQPQMLISICGKNPALEIVEPLSDCPNFARGGTEDFHRQMLKHTNPRFRIHCADQLARKLKNDYWRDAHVDWFINLMDAFKLHVPNFVSTRAKYQDKPEFDKGEDKVPSEKQSLVAKAFSGPHKFLERKRKTNLSGLPKKFQAQQMQKTRESANAVINERRAHNQRRRSHTHGSATAAASGAAGADSDNEMGSRVESAVEGGGGVIAREKANMSAKNAGISWADDECFRAYLGLAAQILDYFQKGYKTVDVYNQEAVPVMRGIFDTAAGLLAAGPSQVPHYAAFVNMCAELMRVFAPNFKQHNMYQYEEVVNFVSMVLFLTLKDTRIDPVDTSGIKLSDLSKCIYPILNDWKLNAPRKVDIYGRLAACYKANQYSDYSVLNPLSVMFKNVMRWDVKDIQNTPAYESEVFLFVLGELANGTYCSHDYLGQATAYERTDALGLLIDYIYPDTKKEAENLLMATNQEEALRFSRAVRGIICQGQIEVFSNFLINCAVNQTFLEIYIDEKDMRYNSDEIHKRRNQFHKPVRRMVEAIDFMAKFVAQMDRDWQKDMSELAQLEAQRAVTTSSSSSSSATAASGLATSGTESGASHPRINLAKPFENEVKKRMKAVTGIKECLTQLVTDTWKGTHWNLYQPNCKEGCKRLLESFWGVPHQENDEAYRSGGGGGGGDNKASAAEGGRSGNVASAAPAGGSSSADGGGAADANPYASQYADGAGKDI